MAKQTRPRQTQGLETELTCQQVMDLIVDYVAEDMEPARRSAFETHIHDCPDCLAFLDTYKVTIRTTRSLRYKDIPGGMRHRVQQFLHAKITGFPPSCSTE